MRLGTRPAANSARENAAGRVLVLEKASKERRGGNTYFSGGLLRIAFDDAEDLRPMLPDVQAEIADFF